MLIYDLKLNFFSKIVLIRHCFYYFYRKKETKNHRIMKEREAQSRDIDTAFISIGLDKLEMNEGQIEGLPCNPRDITSDKFEKLKKDLQEYPEMLKLRGLLVYPFGDKYVIIGGNMRYRAMQELGFTTAPCIVIPQTATVEQLKAYTILDNSGFGKWDWDLLANEWDAQQLTDWGVALPIMESEINPDEFFDKVENAEEKERGDKITVSIPNELAEEKDSIKSIIEDALQDYSGIKVT